MIEYNTPYFLDSHICWTFHASEIQQCEAPLHSAIERDLKEAFEAIVNNNVAGRAWRYADK